MSIIVATTAAVILGWCAAIGLRFKSASFIVMSVMLLLLWEFPRTGISVSLGSMQFYAEDFLALVMLAVAAITSAGDARREAGLGWLLGGVFAALLLIGLLAGSRKYGPAIAANEFRPYFHTIAAYAYIYVLLGRHWRDTARHMHVMALVGVALSVMAIYHVATNGLGGADSWVNIGGDQYQTGRPLVAAQAMVLVCIALVLLGKWLSGGTRGDLWLAAAFLFVSVFCQHRSVWAATAAGVIVLAVHSVVRGRFGLVVLVVVASYLFTVGAVAGGPNGLLEVLAGSLTDRQTYEARTSSWDSLIDRSVSDGALTVILGENWGAGWERLDRNGDVIDFRPHNTYVSVFLRTGVAGVAVVLIAMLLVSWRLVRRGDAVALAVFAAIACYCWAYDVDKNIIILVAWTIYRSCAASSAGLVPRSSRSQCETEATQKRIVPHEDVTVVKLDPRPPRTL